MHICYPSLSYPLNDEPTSGVGAQVRLLAQALRAAGHEISVVDFAGHPAVSDDSGVTVHRVRPSRFHWFAGKLPLIGKTLALPVRELENSFAVWKAVRDIHKSRRIDVVEGTETGMLWLALWRRTPVIIRLHGEQYTFLKFTPGMRLTLGVRFTRAIQRMALRRAKLLISPSYAHAREIQSELHDSQVPIVVVPNNVSLKDITRNGVQRSSQTVIYAGRIERRKGITTFLRAAAQTKQVLPDARFVIAGDFHSSLPEAEFTDVLRSCGLEENVVLVGPVGKTVLADLYKRSTVAVLPSYYETFGLAALEPMAFGTPIIAANSSALPEVVVPEVNGKLVPPGDESALAAAMVELLENSDVRAAMGKAAIKHAAEFDVRNVVGVTERLYRRSADSWSNADAHVFFSPHADDVVLSCGGAVQSLIAQGKTVQVITVFSAECKSEPSAFVRHLHRKWHTLEAPARQRKQEDREALRILGVNQAACWDYLEAPDRYDAEGAPLYATYDEMHAAIAPEDKRLINEISERTLNTRNWSERSVFYFPLSLGQHVDHQILFAIGRRLLAAGKQVRFYEDYPYAERYCLDSRELNWRPETIAVPIARKLRALAAYQSQLYGLGGSLAQARKRLLHFSHRFGSSASERYWDLCFASENRNGSESGTRLPLIRLPEKKRFSDLAGFVGSRRDHDLGDVLPIGAGPCVDIGSGNGRHKELIESRGYRWIGVDARDMRSDTATLQLPSQSQAAVVAWQVLEHLQDPRIFFADVTRVLERGGIFCGGVSFPQPVQGGAPSYLGATNLETLLRENGFGDIKTLPGTNNVMFCARKKARG